MPKLYIFRLISLTVCFSETNHAFSWKHICLSPYSAGLGFVVVPLSFFSLHLLRRMRSSPAWGRDLRFGTDLSWSSCANCRALFWRRDYLWQWGEVERSRDVKTERSLFEGCIKKCWLLGKSGHEFGELGASLIRIEFRELLDSFLKSKVHSHLVVNA